MNDDNWDLINGEAAHAIEVLNYSNQVNVIEALVRLFTHRFGVDEKGCLGFPAPNTLKEFHRTATLFLLHRPGEYRTSGVVVAAGDQVVHNPPAHDEIEHHMAHFFANLEEKWRDSSAVEIGAFALWFVNWVHPFQNGNGRSARAFCYACISLKLGFVIPGKLTVIDLIMQNRAAYYAALRVADNAYAQSGAPDLSAMINFVEELLIQQLSTIPEPDQPQKPNS